MRRRLTRDGLFRRTAAPDSLSGRNPNVPIHVYDIKPNARFPIGSKVTLVDSTFLHLRGTVLGHAAEDRVWVEWSNGMIDQEDVQDLVRLDEVAERVEMMREGTVTASRRPRNAAFYTLDDLKNWNDKNASVITFDEDEDEEGDVEFDPEDVGSCND